MPWAAWGDPAVRPMVMKSHRKAKPKRTQQAKAASAAATPVSTRKPTAKPIAVETAVPQAIIVVSAKARPQTTELGGIGRLRSRSKKPAAMSSAMPMAAPMPRKRTPVVMNPGTRKFT